MDQPPEVLAAIQTGRVVFLVDHSDDVVALTRQGFLATTVPSGLTGGRVVVLPRDPERHDLAEEQVETLAPHTRSIRVVHLPALLPQLGLSEWFANGGSGHRLTSLVRATPQFHLERRRGTRGPLRPELAYQDARQKARVRAELIRSGAGLSFPWNEVHAIVGQLVAGQLVVLGGRAKQGKSTFLRECFEFWVQFGKKVMLVGTEQSVEEVRALWACQALGLEPEAINLPQFQDAILEDIEGRQHELREKALIYVPDKMDIQTLADLTHLAAAEKCDAIIFDHFTRMDLKGRQSKWEESADAIKQVKRLARMNRILLLTAAQLTDGEGVLGQFEVPTGSSWAYTKELQRECDIGLVVWRPLRRAPSNMEVAQARSDPAVAEELVERNVMALRVVAHRLRTGAMGGSCRLQIEGGRISTYIRGPTLDRDRERMA